MNPVPTASTVEELVELPGVRALSVRQPWTTLLLDHGKNPENRTRATTWRGYL